MKIFFTQRDRGTEEHRDSPRVSASSASLCEKIPRWLIGTDLRRALTRIRYGGIAGLVAAGINFIVIMSTYFVGDSGVEGVIRPGGGEFLFVLLEAALVAVLAAGMLKRNRAAAAALLGYQIVSKLVLFGLAIFGLGPGNLNPVSLVLNLVFAYLFFQGLRGVLTWHYLTHPVYPADANK